MTISVVVIVRNGERFLADALDSVRSQTLRPDEVIVVDGQSTDRTLDVAARYSVQVMAQSDRGIANARNLGIARARGEFIAFLDHDDVWMPEKLAAQMPKMRAHPGLGYVVTHLRYRFEGGYRRPGFRVEEGAGYTPSALLARRELFVSAGMFDTRYNLAADAEWFARMHDAHMPHGIVPAVLVEKRIHPANASANIAAYRREWMRVIHESLARRRTPARTRS